MLNVTLPNGDTLWLNPDTLLSLQAAPHTIIKLTTGEKLIVNDTLDTIVERFMAYKRHVYQGGALLADTQQQAH
jgi:flagellar protein FlbD